MADVFISYARSDQATAARVAKGSQAGGYDVWWDADLPAHRSYSEVIERNLEEAKAVVVLWSATAAKSQWVRAEADVARNAGKLVQASIDGSIPPLPFNQIQCADLKGWRGASNHAGWSKLQTSIQALVANTSEPAKSAQLPVLDRIRANRLILAVAAALLLLVAAAGLFYFLRPTAVDKKPVLAVLPFRPLSAQDESLVSGIWEDTRQAIGRNPQIVVLGPNTVEQLAEKGDAATKKAADYMLQASVRTAGDRIRVSANLVRTKDGEQMWTQDFDRKLDDVFALQSQIATEIEGRIRGRLAEQGGVKPEHIATSGEVYSLYTDARAKIRKREFGKSDEAVDQLVQALKIDPNFAPGWATLAQATQLGAERQGIDPPEMLARRAIELAPNLAAGHASLALALHLKGPVARGELERAVALDPNDYEALNWLGNARSFAGDKKGALDAWSRAAEIESLFYPAVVNKIRALQEIGDRATLQAFLAEERRLGAGDVLIATEMGNATDQSDLAKALNLGLQYRVANPNTRSSPVDGELFDPILHLGYEDLSLKLGLLPPFGPSLWRNEQRGVAMVEAMQLDPEHLLSLSPLAENYLRACLLNGGGRKVADFYLSSKITPESLARIENDEQVLVTAPFFAVALRESGHGDEAKNLLAFVESRANELPPNHRDRAIYLARIYAVEGRTDEALTQLQFAVGHGWLPKVANLQTDLDADPAFGAVRTDARFQKARQALLAALAREKAQVDMNLVRRAGSL